MLEGHCFEQQAANRAVRKIKFFRDVKEAARPEHQ